MINERRYQRLRLLVEGETEAELDNAWCDLVESGAHNPLDLWEFLIWGVGHRLNITVDPYVKNGEVLHAQTKRNAYFEFYKDGGWFFCAQGDNVRNNRNWSVTKALEFLEHILPSDDVL